MEQCRNNAERDVVNLEIIPKEAKPWKIAAEGQPHLSSTGPLGRCFRPIATSSSVLPPGICAFCHKELCWSKRTRVLSSVVDHPLSSLKCPAGRDTVVTESPCPNGNTFFLLYAVPSLSLRRAIDHRDRPASPPPSAFWLSARTLRSWSAHPRLASPDLARSRAGLRAGIRTLDLQSVLTPSPADIAHMHIREAMIF
jgi:hypothetical protein